MHCSWIWTLACLMTAATVLQEAYAGSGERVRRRRGRKLRHSGARARLRRYLSGRESADRTWNPVHLTSQTGFNLAINSDGTVTSSSTDSPEARIQRHSVDVGVVLLEGMASHTYLAINEEGFLISTPTIGEENYFLETLTSNYYTTFKSALYRRHHWYIGIKRRSGLFRNRPFQEKKLRRSCLFMVRAI